VGLFTKRSKEPASPEEFRPKAAHRDFTEFEIETIRLVKPRYTMTSPERVCAVIRAVDYIVSNGILGAIVECGVYRGGSMMAVARTLLRHGVTDRDIYLFDTFQGMPEPTELDVKWNGESAREKAEETRDGSGFCDWCRATLEEVREAVYSIGYPRERFHFVPGLVQDTIPEHAPDSIALVRHDTDFYESTCHELEHLFPRVVDNGVIIFDDYGTWEGSRRAIDEYIARNRIPLLLNRIDRPGRIAVKTRA
jgi:hypothetical protein